MSELCIAALPLMSDRDAFSRIDSLLAQEPAWRLLPCAASPALPDIDLILVVALGAPVAEVFRAVSRLQEEGNDRPLILLMDRSSDPSVLPRLFREGADDIVLGPLDPVELRARIGRALDGAVGRGEMSTDAMPEDPHPGLIGRSPAFQAQVGRVPAIAGCDAGVLILGETGTGKEIFAQAIHYSSSRASGPWVAVNCAAIPSELIEDELFGHLRGAYTHAQATREGLVSEAEHGSLFLDEIDTLPLESQAKLLRFVNDKEYRALGANKVRRADVRVIVASNRDLSDLVAQGRFRQDLFYRLDVLTLHLPPLRERMEDIPLLARHFLDLVCRDRGRRVRGLTPAGMRRLLEHDWPGNARELKHVLERAVLMSSNPILSAADIELGDGPPKAPESESFRDAKTRVVERFERNYIEGVLSACDGNVTEAARTAKKHRRAFFELMRKYRIDAAPYRRDTTDGQLTSNRPS